MFHLGHSGSRRIFPLGVDWEKGWRNFGYSLEESPVKMMSPQISENDKLKLLNIKIIL